MQLTISLHPAGTRCPAGSVAGPCQAWYVPGHASAQWLGEILTWNCAHQQLRLYPLPRGADATASQGVLVVAEQPVSSRRAVPYRAVGSLAFYLPMDAELVPAPSEQELSELLTPGCTYAWHPAVGLIKWDSGGGLAVADLVAAPEVPCQWTEGAAGVTFPERLEAVVLAEPPTFAELLGGASDGIGSQAGDLEQLPPAPGEPGMLDQLRNAGKRGLAQFAKWLSDARVSGHTGSRQGAGNQGAGNQGAGVGASPASGAGGGSWFGGLRNWAQQTLRQVSEETERARHRQLHRLLNLLNSDPDRGLKFAIGFGQQGGQHRGLAAAGNALGANPVDFNWERMHSGGYAADFWNIPYPLRVALQTRYRELALREERLGRFRRAAYIYAELLGDWGNAANSLASGAHWREAALVFQEKLQRPDRAAECLVEAGAIGEALPLLIAAGHHEKAAELYVKLGQQDAATQQLRAAVAQALEKTDYFRAADLTANQLGEPAEALRILSQGWPYSGQAVGCLQRFFELAGQTGLHSQAADQVAAVLARNEPRLLSQALPVLAHVATSYPERALHESTARAARRAVAGALPRATRRERRELVEGLAALAPGDPQLRRDCQLFLQSVPHSAGAPLRASAKLRRLNRIRLPEGVRWQSAVGAGEVFYALGFMRRRLVIACARWDGTVHCTPRTAWQDFYSRTEPLILLAVTPVNLLVHALNRPPLQRISPFGAIDRLGEVRAGGLSHVPGQLVGAARTFDQRVWTLGHLETEVVLSLGGEQGQQTSFSLPQDGAEALPVLEWMAQAQAGRRQAAVPMVSHGRRLLIGFRNQVLCFDNGNFSLIPADQPITAVASRGLARNGCAALAHPRGGSLIWGESEQIGETFAHELDAPCLGFNRGGHLIAVSQQGGEVYSTTGGELRWHDSLPAVRSHPLAVVAGQSSGRFGIFDADGCMTVYQID